MWKLNFYNYRFSCICRDCGNEFLTPDRAAERAGGTIRIVRLVRWLFIFPMFFLAGLGFGALGAFLGKSSGDIGTIIGGVIGGLIGMLIPLFFWIVSGRSRKKAMQEYEEIVEKMKSFER